MPKIVIGLMQQKVENLVAIKSLIIEGTDLNVTNDEGETALILVSSFGLLEIIMHLIKAGDDIDIADKSHSTALLSASKYGHIEVVEHLINAGADVNTVD